MILNEYSLLRDGREFDFLVGIIWSIYRIYYFNGIGRYVLSMFSK